MSDIIANKRFRDYFSIYFERVQLLSIVLIIIILIKLSEKCKNEVQNLINQSFLRIPIFYYGVPFCLWLKQYNVLLPFIHVIFLNGLYLKIE